MKQTGIDPHIKVLNVWHDWFKGDGEPGAASGKEIHDLLARKICHDLGVAPVKGS